MYLDGVERVEWMEKCGDGNGGGGLRRCFVQPSQALLECRQSGFGLVQTRDRGYVVVVYIQSRATAPVEPLHGHFSLM